METWIMDNRTLKGIWDENIEKTKYNQEVTKIQKQRCKNEKSTQENNGWKLLLKKNLRQPAVENCSRITDHRNESKIIVNKFKAYSDVYILYVAASSKAFDQVWIFKVWTLLLDWHRLLKNQPLLNL